MDSPAADGDAITILTDPASGLSDSIVVRHMRRRKPPWKIPSDVKQLLWESHYALSYDPLHSFVPVSISPISAQ